MTEQLAWSTPTLTEMFFLGHPPFVRITMNGTERMVPDRGIDFAHLIEPVARQLLGEPNDQLSSAAELRFGKKGSLAVDLEEGTWFDHESNAGGGVVDLVKREVPNESPMSWLKREKYIGIGDQRYVPYDFRDERDVVLYQEVRVELVETGKRVKSFFRRPDGNGGWITGKGTMKDARWVLYRLPELVATEPGALVFIVEGPKKAEALISRGLCATCSPMGAGKWRAEYNDFLRDLDIVILPDNDPQAKNAKTGELLFHPDGRPRVPGIDHAESVARQLHGIARRVRVVMLPDLPPKGDVVDWLDAGRTKQDLIAQAERATDWLPKSEERGASHSGVTLDDFRAYMPQHSYIYIPSREPWPASSVNARIPPVVVGVDEDGEPVAIKASTWLDQNQPVEQMTWAPGLPMLVGDRLVSEGGWIEKEGATCFNLYRPPTIEPGDATQAGPWLDHVREVYPDDADHIITWCAQRVQHPEIKINHGLVLGGAQGIGKDTLLEPVKRTIGPWNFNEVSPQHMLGRFNGYLRSVVLRVNEARDLGDINRYQFYDHMKAYLAAPPDVLRVDEKNLREYSVFNCVGVVITTNHKTDGIFLPAEDRRHFVAWSDRTPEDFEEGYWNKLWHWYSEGGDRHVAAYLANLDISSFDPKAPPPKTQAFWDIVDANRAPEDAELADVLDQLNNPAAVSLDQIRGVASPEFDRWLSDRKNLRAIPHRLEACGYIPVRNPDSEKGLWVINKKRQVVYARATLSLRDQISAVSELRSPDPEGDPKFPV
jgi:hypothetical protein